jgi:hypothetical protein
MSAFLGFLVKVFLIYLAIKFVWSLVGGKINLFHKREAKTKTTVKRFNADGVKIEDADFKDVK